MADYAAEIYIPLKKIASGLLQCPEKDGVPEVEVPSDIVVTTVLYEFSSGGSTML